MAKVDERNHRATIREKVAVTFLIVHGDANRNVWKNSGLNKSACFDCKVKTVLFFLRTKPSVSSQTRHRRIFPLENLVTPSLIRPIELSSLGLSRVFSWFTVILSSTFHKSLGLKSRGIKVKTCLENKKTQKVSLPGHI